jgi:uncharacterized protein YjbI with pentapeptide repeats
MILPRRAPVRPRVLSSLSGEPFPLEDEVRQLLDGGARGWVSLQGGPGAGKTTALRHLAALLHATPRLYLLDGPAGKPSEYVPGALVITTGPVPSFGRLLVSYTLASWREDDWIEYLLAVHGPRCGSVIRRLRGAGDGHLLRGIPELCVLVLDRLARDENLPSVRAALAAFLEDEVAGRDLQLLTRAACLDWLLVTGSPPPEESAGLAHYGASPALLNVLRHEPAQVLVAAEQIVTDLLSGAPCAYLGQRLRRLLVEETAFAVNSAPGALQRLQRMVLGPPVQLQPMVASILHATGNGWSPAPGHLPVMTGAYLTAAVWPGINLAGAHLEEADLSGADLRRADLARVHLEGANLGQAVLHGACLAGALAETVDFSDADLSGVRAERGHFQAANLQRADLQGAVLRGAFLTGANLTESQFRQANLTGAGLTGCQLEDADFTGARLDSANLSGLKLRLACFEGACFARADLRKCDLETMQLPAAQFAGANLEGAYLTGSVMPEANFAGACLRDTGLAEISWERADLRGADLKGASFHLGSSRSGLVGSPIASEGSRTGFYTDDYEEQSYKAPEEIRKANLCGADLRGADVTGVDFYLVDLRGARYDPQQGEHFRRCGAILEVRE